jgi:hypothetical protein
MTPAEGDSVGWRPGLPVVTAADVAAWQAWSRARILEGQRKRRGRLRRIDYYPSPEVAAIIDARCLRAAGGDYSSVIDRLILAAAIGRLPE